MDSIYLDNASTSFPKAPGVGEAMGDYIQQVGVNIARGGYRSAYAAAEAVLDTRELLCRLFHGPDPCNVVFTAGVTASLNILLKGFLRPGDHVLTTGLEHNAVLRPLTQLQEDGVEFDRIPCNQQGELDVAALDQLVRPATKAVVMLHASNVCGALLPVARVGEFCQQHGLRLILDCAQTGGVFPIDMAAWHVDALAFAGHKGLLGPQGIGGFVISSDFAAQVRPLLSGGTGSVSHLETVPEFLPDRFEPGTQNLPGIYGLRAALLFLEQTGLPRIYRQEQALTKRLLAGLSALPGLRLLGPGLDTERAAVVSVDFPGRDNGEIAFRLAEDYGVQTRCGLHCAPGAHRSLGSFPQGAVRFSPGFFTTESEIDQALAAVAEILSGSM